MMLHLNHFYDSSWSLQLSQFCDPGSTLPQTYFYQSVIQPVVKYEQGFVFGVIVAIGVCGPPVAQEAGGSYQWVWWERALVMPNRISPLFSFFV